MLGWGGDTGGQEASVEHNWIQARYYVYMQIAKIDWSRLSTHVCGTSIHSCQPFGYAVDESTGTSGLFVPRTLVNDS